MGGFCLKILVVEDWKKVFYRKDVNGREKEGVNGNGERYLLVKKIDFVKRLVFECK